MILNTSVHTGITVFILALWAICLTVGSLVENCVISGIFILFVIYSSKVYNKIDKEEKSRKEFDKIIKTHREQKQNKQIKKVLDGSKYFEQN